MGRKPCRVFWVLGSSPRMTLGEAAGFSCFDVTALVAGIHNHRRGDRHSESGYGLPEQVRQ